NLAKHLARKLGRVQYKKFLDQFYCAHNSRCEELFESRWSRHAWALVYTCTTFCAGMNSTQHVESINGILKAKVGAQTTLTKLVESIEKRIKMKPNANKYLTSEALACQRLQISQSCLYRPYQINNLAFNQNDDLEYAAGFLEKDYQESQILFSSMIKLIEARDICKIWQVRLFSNLFQIQMIPQRWFANPINAIEQPITIRPDCFNYEIQQYTSKKAEYCRGIGIAKKGVQIALDTDTINKFIGLLYNFIESKSTQADNPLRLDFIKSVTNSHIISHREVDKSNSHKISKSNKALKESDITNKST
ncbi:25972_t:CDS:2, partial [Gigaspora rosea]